MPRLRLHGVGTEGNPRSVDRTDACFRQLGKDSGYVGYNKNLARDGWAKFTKVVYSEVASSEIPNLRAGLSFLFNNFVFMRTCMTPPEEILKTREAEFNLEDYTQNEVMLAMFWLRSFIKHRTGSHGYGYALSRGLTHEIAFIYHMTVELPSLCYRPGSWNTCRGTFHNYGLGDECLLCYGIMKASSFMRIARVGVPESLDYEGGTMYENSLNAAPYPKNIQTLHKESVKEGDTAQDFLTNFWHEVTEGIESTVLIRADDSEVSTLGLTLGGRIQTVSAEQVTGFLAEHGPRILTNVCRRYDIEI